MKTRKQYMNKEVSHHEYYSQFVTKATKDYVLSGVTVEEIKASEDGHLNDMKIPFNHMGRGGGQWWWDYSPANEALIKEAGEGRSYSTYTCIGKAAARILTEE